MLNHFNFTVRGGFLNLLTRSRIRSELIATMLQQEFSQMTGSGLRSVPCVSQGQEPALVQHVVKTTAVNDSDKSIIGIQAHGTRRFHDMSLTLERLSGIIQSFQLVNLSVNISDVQHFNNPFVFVVNYIIAWIQVECKNTCMYGVSR